MLPPLVWKQFTGIQISKIGAVACPFTADDLEIDDSASHLLGIGVQHKRNNWLIIGEFSFLTMEGFLRDQYGAYLTLGRHFGPWMPYATVAKRSTRGPDSDSRSGFLDAEVNALLGATRFDTTSISLGISRELCEHAILKLQADNITPHTESWGLYTNYAPDYNYLDPESNWLITMSLDFVF